jgi:hypothetical protein
MSLTPEESTILTDTLRRNLWLATPTPVFKDGVLDHVNAAFFPADMLVIRQLIEKAGGWRPSRLDDIAAMRRFEEMARGVGAGTYDLSTWNVGELSTLIAESEGVEELAVFRAAAEVELKARSA